MVDSCPRQAGVDMGFADHMKQKNPKDAIIQTPNRSYYSTSSNDLQIAAKLAQPKSDNHDLKSQDLAL